MSAVAGAEGHVPNDAMEALWKRSTCGCMGGLRNSPLAEARSRASSRPATDRIIPRWARFLTGGLGGPSSDTPEPPKEVDGVGLWYLARAVRRSNARIVRRYPAAALPPGRAANGVYPSRLGSAPSTKACPSGPMWTVAESTSLPGHESSTQSDDPSHPSRGPRTSDSSERASPSHTAAPGNHAPSAALSIAG